MNVEPDNAMRMIFTTLALTALAACQPTIPDSAAGVGFQDYDSYAQQREARLRGGAEQAQDSEQARQQVGRPLSAMADMDAGDGDTALAEDDGARIARDALAAIGSRRGDDAAGGSQDGSGDVPAAIVNDQDYEDVLRREGEAPERSLGDDMAPGDADRLQPIIPEPLPDRSGHDAPNIVAYALNTTNRVGEQVYQRSGLFAESRFQRNCAEYNTQEEAQEDFLRRGGPERDPRGLDPNGDGFACWWDPEPYRAAARAGD